MQETIKLTDRNDVRDLIREKYDAAALTVLNDQGAACCERPGVDTVSTSLQLNAFKALLEAHREKQFHLVLPNENAVPVAFHITEVAHVQKRFIDCGGKLHTIETCQLQVWLGPDTDHRLLAGKMADVLKLAAKVLPEGKDLDIEMEYEDITVSQYPVSGYTITNDAVVLKLAYKHTDCLAKDVCLPSIGGCGPSCSC